MDYGAKVRGRKEEGEFRSVPIPCGGMPCSSGACGILADRQFSWPRQPSTMNSKALDM